MQSPPSRRVASFRFESPEPETGDQRTLSSDRSRSSRPRSSKNSKSRKSKKSTPPSHNQFTFENSRNTPPKETPPFEQVNTGGPPRATPPNFSPFPKSACLPEKDTPKHHLQSSPSLSLSKNPLTPTLPLHDVPADIAQIHCIQLGAGADSDSTDNFDIDRTSANDASELYWRRRSKSNSASLAASLSAPAAEARPRLPLMKRAQTDPSVKVKAPLGGRVEGGLEVVRKGFLAKFLCAPRYCVFEPESRRIFMWKNKKAINTGTSSIAVCCLLSCSLLSYCCSTALLLLALPACSPCFLLS